MRIVAELETAESEPEEGSALGNQVLTPIWRELEDEAIRHLDAITIEDLCRKARSAGVEPGTRAQPDFTI